MTDRQNLGGIESAIIDLDTAVRTLQGLVEDLDGSEKQCPVCFLATHFGAIHDRLRREFDRICRADRLKVVDNGGAS